MEYALIKNGEVINIIVADQSFIDTIQQEYEHIEAMDTLYEQSLSVKIGSKWSATKGFFDADVYVPVSIVDLNTKITVGSFFDRFGTHKYPILADQNPLVQALIKDVSVRKYVDLADPQLPTGLGLLVQAGHAIDPQKILTDPVTENEQYR